MRFNLSYKEDVTGFISRVVTGLNDFSPAFKEVGPSVRKEIARQFDLSNPNNWRPLTAKYARLKERRHGKKPILVATGQLKRGYASLESTEIAATSYVYGSPVRWGRYHQYAVKSTRRRPLATEVAEKLVITAIINRALTFGASSAKVGR